MTTELTYLSWTTVLGILLLIPYGAAGLSQYGLTIASEVLFR